MVARDLLLAQLETRDTLSPCDLQLLLCHIGKCHLPKVPVGLFESPWCRSAPWCVAAGRTDGLHWGLLQIPPPPAWPGLEWQRLGASANTLLGVHLPPSPPAVSAQPTPPSTAHPPQPRLPTPPLPVHPGAGCLRDAG